MPKILPPKLYAVHGYVNRYYIPLVHCQCLLTNKATATYVHLLNTTQANCAARNFRFSSHDVVHFEISMLSAIQSVTSVNCCRLHLGQARCVTRTASTLGWFTKTNLRTFHIGWSYTWFPSSRHVRNVSLLREKSRMLREQVAQLSQRNRAAAWVSFGWP